MTQSRISPEYARPSLVVDGNANSDWDKKSCTSTLREDYPWISLDMGENYLVRWVTITNTGDHCELPKPTLELSQHLVRSGLLY